MSEQTPDPRPYPRDEAHRDPHDDPEESPMNDETAERTELLDEAAAGHPSSQATRVEASAEPEANPLLVTHLVMGLVFLGIAAFWALQEAAVIDADADWVLPLVLVMAGAAGLVAALSGRNR